MKNSLIPKKHLVPGKDYWCTYNRWNVLHLMKYVNNDIFQWNESTESYQNIRVMFEGYTNINKSRIPGSYLVPKRHYWCKYHNDIELTLMRCENENSFYSISHDVFWPSTDVNVIFEDYENGK